MQKKSTLFIIFLFVSAISMAQFEKGTTTFNFNIGDIQNTNIRNKAFNKNNNISFNPGFGYFIKKNWEIGVGVNFNSIHVTDSSHGGFYLNSKTYGVFAYTNYYFGNGKLKPYLTFQAGWNHLEGKYMFPLGLLDDFKDNYFHAAIGGGLNWNISKRFSLFTEATYWKERPLSLYGHSRFNLTVGARFFFNNKKKR